MIAVERVTGHPKKGEPGVQLVLIFGVGLIGEALVMQLFRRGFSGVAELAFSWREPSLVREAEMKSILGWVRSRMGAHVQSGVSKSQIAIDVVWSAGRGGFASTWESLEAELSAFQTVAQLSERLLDTMPVEAHRFHLMSSAGGLFEGQLNVVTGSLPTPMRPYGELKLAQEQLLATLSGPIGKTTYRPSSVYGFVSPKSRLGLIAMIIKNGLQGQFTSIFAEALTLRDFVPVCSVAAFMARKIESRRPEANSAYLLASAKPSSVVEVLNLLERILDRSLYYVFRVTDENKASNTYNIRAVADGFHPQDLETGMRSVLLAMRQQYSINTLLNQRI